MIFIRVLVEEQEKFIKKIILNNRYDEVEKDKIIGIIGEVLSQSRRNKEDLEDCIKVLEFIINDKSGWD